MSQSTYGSAKVVVREFWYHGFTYNTTPGSRTEVSDTIKNGYAFCLDPEAVADRASLPTGTNWGQMDIKPVDERLNTGTLKPGTYIYNVTKPATGILGLVAGIAVDLPPEGKAGPQWIKLAVQAEAIDTWFLGDTTASSPAGYEAQLGTVNGQWYLSPLAPGNTSDATVQAGLRACGRPLFAAENVASAAIRKCRIGGHACMPAL